MTHQISLALLTLLLVSGCASTPPKTDLRVPASDPTSYAGELNEAQANRIQALLSTQKDGMVAYYAAPPPQIGGGSHVHQPSDDHVFLMKVSSMKFRVEKVRDKKYQVGFTNTDDGKDSLLFTDNIYIARPDGHFKNINVLTGQVDLDENYSNYEIVRKDGAFIVQFAGKYVPQVNP